jgi:hypothetical protein
MSSRMMRTGGFIEPADAIVGGGCPTKTFKRKEIRTALTSISLHPT